MPKINNEAPIMKLTVVNLISPLEIFRGVLMLLIIPKPQAVRKIREIINDIKVKAANSLPI